MLTYQCRWCITNIDLLFSGPPLGGDILTKCQGPLSPKGPLSQGLTAQNCDMACGVWQGPKAEKHKPGRPPSAKDMWPKNEIWYDPKGPLSHRFATLKIEYGIYLSHRVWGKKFGLGRFRRALQPACVGPPKLDLTGKKGPLCNGIWDPKIKIW